MSSSLEFSLPKIKTKIETDSITLEPLAEKLYAELESINAIERLKGIPQLGDVWQSTRGNQTRFDYLALQLHLHRVAGMKVRKNMPISYNSEVNQRDFCFDEDVVGRNKIQIKVLMQILVLAFGIGHFSNAFTASKAALLFANSNLDFKNSILQSIGDSSARKSAMKIITDQDVLHFHLVNSLVILSQCNQSLQSVRIAIALVIAYLNNESLPPDSKLLTVFKVFKAIRDIAFVAMDLQNLKMPVKLDLNSENGIAMLLDERLSQYNDTDPYESLISSLKKLLDDNLYFEPGSQFRSYVRSKKILFELKNNVSGQVDYLDQIFNSGGVFNAKYNIKNDFDAACVLKLTFSAKEKEVAIAMSMQFDQMKGVRIGQYNRHSGETTLLVALSKYCKNKRKIAFQVLKKVVKHLQNTEAKPNDKKYLLAVKFFLYYLGNERPVRIDSTITNDCVICVRGYRKRVNIINEQFLNATGTNDQKHEVEFMRNVLSDDCKNDFGIMVPASIKYDKSQTDHKDYHEFDGLIIFPNRPSHQIVFLEAKNTNSPKTKGKKELKGKLFDFGIDYSVHDIIPYGKDTAIKWSVE